MEHCLGTNRNWAVPINYREDSLSSQLGLAKMARNCCLYFTSLTALPPSAYGAGLVPNSDFLLASMAVPITSDARESWMAGEMAEFWFGGVRRKSHAAVGDEGERRRTSLAGHRRQEGLRARWVAHNDGRIARFGLQGRRRPESREPGMIGVEPFRGDW